jgi:predicted nucleic acid-binding protein
VPRHRVRDDPLRTRQSETTRISTWLHAFDYLPSDDDAFTRVLEIQRHAVNAGFHRALSLPDLLVAATAEAHRRTVLHYDCDFDMIATLTGQPTEWVAPPGSADR